MKLLGSRNVIAERAVESHGIDRQRPCNSSDYYVHSTKKYKGRRRGRRTPEKKGRFIVKGCVIAWLYYFAVAEERNREFPRIPEGAQKLAKYFVTNVHGSNEKHIKQSIY